MNISINWLKEYIDFQGKSVKEISDGLTLAGLEAEGFTELQRLENVVTAKVIHKEKHPNADKLNLCRVTDGVQEYQVVCGAPNVAEGQIVPFAKIGAVLGDIKIKEAKLRGVESFGMICSERELGLTDEHNGIMVLPSDTPLGKDINEVVGTGDTIVEFNATPNRPDWLSVIGVAREAAAVFNTSVKYPEYNLVENNEKADDYISVKVENIEKCPIYFARVIKNIKIGTSPLWLQAKLRAAGVRPINNIVDVTNYVLMEYGQPLHAFDIRNIDKGIIVRNAYENEKITALDGKEYTLDSNMLIIADNSKPLAIAGVMGGEHTSVMNDTTTVVLECAYFEPTQVRRTSKKLALSSDSSYRYERGIDYGATETLSDYAAYLIAKICDGEVVAGKVGINQCKIEEKQVISHASNINKLLGTDFSINDMAGVLNNLQIQTSIDGDKLVSKIPTFRNDITKECDIAEEVARIIGYDKIGYTMPKMDSEIDIQSPKVRYSRIARNLMENLGYNEVLNFSFLGADYLSIFDKNEDNFVKLLNPISQDMAWMRTYLFPSIIKNMQTNRNMGYTSVKLFELSSVYKSLGKDRLADERLHLSLGVFGSYYDETWINIPKVDTFYYIKGSLENLFEKFGVACEYKREENIHFLHPGKSAGIYLNNKNIGFIGYLHPDTVEELNIKTTCYIAEIDFSTIIDESFKANEAQKSSMKYKKFSRFPSIQRDLALIVKTKVNASDILENIIHTNPVITDAQVFDVFEGKPINLGYKSIAVRITFTDMEKTLRDEDINPIIDNILKNLEKEFEAVLR